MIEYEELYRILKRNKINYFTGVPDSVLKGLNFYLDKINYKVFKFIQYKILNPL